MTKIEYTQEDVPADLAKDAMLAQSACNATALIHSLSTVTSKLWQIASKESKGTDWVNQHPIVMVYLNHINYLNMGTCPDIDGTKWMLVARAANNG